MDEPTYQDVLDARPRVYESMRPSPLLHHPLLDEWTGCETWVKHENHNPTGSFKVRGGVNLVAQLDAEARARGVIAASTGNHGQSLAMACRRHGVRCRIVVPAGNNPDKNAAMRALGAELEEHGADFDAAREYVEAVAARDGLRYVHSADEPQLIAGVATWADEVFEAMPTVEAVFVPIGGGSGAAGCCLARDGRGVRTRVMGVQAARADAFTRSWRDGTRVTAARADTLAEGLATRVTFDLPFAMLRRGLEDVITLDEEALAEAMRAALRCTHNLAEGAGAAALGAARVYGRRHPGARVACVMTGGNLEAAKLRAVLDGTR